MTETPKWEPSYQKMKVLREDKEVRTKEFGKSTFSLTASSLSEIRFCFWDELEVAAASGSTSGCLHSNCEVTISMTSRNTSKIGFDMDIFFAFLLLSKTPVPKTLANSLSYPTIESKIAKQMWKRTKITGSLSNFTVPTSQNTKTKN